MRRVAGILWCLLLNGFLFASKPDCVSPFLELAQTPACVEATPVNTSGLRGARLMIVFRTNGCYFDKGATGCTMCNFKEHAIRPQDYRLQPHDLEVQLDKVLKERAALLPEMVQIDLLTLGNFLNRGEVPEAFWKHSMERVSQIPTLKRVVVESRTPFIKEENLRALRHALRPDVALEVSVGVETTNDYLRNQIIKKDMSLEQLREAMRIVGKFADQNVTFQAYLLIKPQTLTERQGIEDAVQSAATMAELARELKVTTRISFEPVFVTHNTPLEAEFLAGRYQPPNLWSVVEVIQRTHSHPAVKGNRFFNGIYVGLSDEGLSKGRESSSCPSCDAKLRAAIQEYNGSQDLGCFSKISCPCKPTMPQWNRPLSFHLLPSEFSVYKLSEPLVARTPASEGFWWASGNTLVYASGAFSGDNSVFESPGWRVLKLRGSWAHHETGIVAPVLATLALKHVPIMFVSDWETDYLLIPGAHFNDAVVALSEAGHSVVSDVTFAP